MADVKCEGGDEGPCDERPTKLITHDTIGTRRYCESHAFAAKDTLGGEIEPYTHALYEQRQRQEAGLQE